MSQQTDLQALRCPFCGGEPELLTGDNTWSQIGCKLCGAKGPEFMLNDTKALAGWNRRALLAAAAPVAPQWDHKAAFREGFMSDDPDFEQAWADSLTKHRVAEAGADPRLQENDDGLTRPRQP